jgi:hypothetical protein
MSEPTRVQSAESVQHPRFGLLLIALAGLLVSFPFAQSTTLTRGAFLLTSHLVLFAGLYAMRRSPLWLACASVLVVGGVGLSWLGALFPDNATVASPGMLGIGGLLMAASLVQVVVFLLLDLFADDQVNAERLYGAMSV